MYISISRKYLWSRCCEMWGSDPPARPHDTNARLQYTLGMIEISHTKLYRGTVVFCYTDHFSTAWQKAI